MATDFPNAPTVGEEFTGLGGITYVWDGVKWTNGVCGGSVSNALDSIIAGQCIGLVNTPGPPQTLTISALIPCIQTPWLQNIDGGLHLLSNVTGAGIGGAAPAAGIRVYSGGIGINTPAPSSPQLTITGRATDTLPGIFITAVPSNAQPIISINNDIRQANIIYYGSATANPGAFSFECAGGNDYIRFYTSGGTAGERMRITNVGQVGIGTITPNATLHVVGAEALWSGSASANCAFYFGRTGTDGTLAIAGAANQMASGANPGDIILRSESQQVILGAVGNGILYVTSTHAEVSCGGGLFISADPVSSGGGINYQILRDGPTGWLQFVGHQATFSGFQFITTPAVAGTTQPDVTITGNGTVGIGVTTPAGILHVSGNALSGGGIYMYYNGNVGNLYPSFNSANLAVGWNFAAGLQEIDFFNVTSIGPAVGGFRWYQQTGASAATYLCGVDSTGNFFADRFEAASAYFGPTTTLSCPMLFCNNADPAGGMAEQTVCIWADQANSRLVIDFKNSLGGVYRGYIPVA